ncbi:MAG: protein phosphatase 2C domain-containing protein [Actinomycetota bacterium]|nr:protein phosphatase 2C domain-containing protein [Actinomycetota bacterium]
MGGFFFDSSARSVLGLVRSSNEDSAFVSGRLIAVADGMGGHVGGEIASRVAIKTLQSLAPMLTDSTIDTDSTEDLLLNSLYTIDVEIGNYAHEAIEMRGMGTTLTTLLVRNDRIALLHVGDSRCYRLRANTLEQLSNDHTVIQELLSQGAITPAQAVDHPQRSILTQALMGDGEIAPLLQLFEAKENDRYLLCSDGLSGVLTTDEIKSLMMESDKEIATRSLIDAAYIQGAHDNITILLADLTRTEVIVNEVLGAAL